ncbi:MAG: copper amine oxidase N-terminal domain-containing protein [Armatimonadota bacterium]
MRTGRPAVVLLLLGCCATVACAGGELLFDVQPVTLEGRTLVPLRPIFEWLGAKVTYEEGHIKAYRSEEAIAPQVELWLGSTQAKVGEAPYQLDVPPQLIFDRCFVPLRFVAEAFGVWVEAEGQQMKLSLPQENIEAVMAIPPHPQTHLGKIWRIIQRWYDALPPEQEGQQQSLPHWELYSKQAQARIIEEVGPDAPQQIERHWGGREVKGLRILDGGVEPGATKGWAEVTVGYRDGTVKTHRFSFVREPGGWRVDDFSVVEP